MNHYFLGQEEIGTARTRGKRCAAEMQWQKQQQQDDDEEEQRLILCSKTRPSACTGGGISYEEQFYQIIEQLRRRSEVSELP